MVIVNMCRANYVMNKYFLAYITIIKVKLEIFYVFWT